MEINARFDMLRHKNRRELEVVGNLICAQQERTWAKMMGFGLQLMHEIFIEEL